MTIGILRLEIFINNSSSLKERRMALESLRVKLRNNFNVAVAQVDGQDKWQKAVFAVVGVEKNRDHANSTMSEVVNFIDGFHNVSIIDYELELL